MFWTCIKKLCKDWYLISILRIFFFSSMTRCCNDHADEDAEIHQNRYKDLRKQCFKEIKGNQSNNIQLNFYIKFFVIKRFFTYLQKMKLLICSLAKKLTKQKMISFVCLSVLGKKLTLYVTLYHNIKQQQK